MKFNLVQGYGLTETCSAGTLQPMDCAVDGVAGAPVRCLAMRLKDCDKKEADGSYTFLDKNKTPYLTTDRSHNGEPCLGRGEVWMKGANVSSGYYCEEAMTRKEFDKEGWFHTGDVAIWTPGASPTTAVAATAATTTTTTTTTTTLNTLVLYILIGNVDCPKYCRAQCGDTTRALVNGCSSCFTAAQSGPSKLWIASRTW